MGCLCSKEKPPGEPVLESVSVAAPSLSNEPAPSTTASNNKVQDAVPLLVGPEPVNFAALTFSSDSSDIEVDLERIEQLLKSVDTKPDEKPNSDVKINNEKFQENISDGLSMEED